MAAVGGRENLVYPENGRRRAKAADFLSATLPPQFDQCLRDAY